MRRWPSRPTTSDVHREVAGQWYDIFANGIPSAASLKDPLFLSGLFGSKPKIPAPAAVTPTVATPAVAAAADAQRMRARAASGRAATMLTSTEEQSQNPR